MYGLFTPVLLLQAFCVYHAYKNNSEQRWFWLIIFFPLIGSIIYMVHHFNNVGNVQTIQENIKEVVITNYRVQQLEKAVRFSDSIQNKVNLADAYTEMGRYQDAGSLYSDCLQGFMSEDTPIRMKLLSVHYMNGDYDAAVALGEKLHSEKAFKNSFERVYFAWSLYNRGNVYEAEAVFSDLNRSYTNYYQRLEFCKFLIKTEKSEAAKEMLAELFEEFDQMQTSERRLKKHILREARDLYERNFKT